MGTHACAAQTTHQTAHGQLLDITTAPIGSVDLAKYTEATYMRIVTFKTAFYSFYLPVACGLLVGGVTHEAAFATAKQLCIQMGQYFQAWLPPSPGFLGRSKSEKGLWSHASEFQKHGCMQRIYVQGTRVLHTVP